MKANPNRSQKPQATRSSNLVRFRSGEDATPALNADRRGGVQTRTDLNQRTVAPSVENGFTFKFKHRTEFTQNRVGQ